MNRRLQALYESTAEDMLFAVGLIQLSGQQLRPYIHIHYPGWGCDKLAVVRHVFKDGLTLSAGSGADNESELHLATRQRVMLQCDEGGETSVLRSPAWSAQFENVRTEVVESFVLNRRHCGGFAVLLQTPDWEFTSVLNDETDSTSIGPIRSHCTPIPPGECG